MPNGYSLHIGLNHVDPDAYNGWDGRLYGCLNDANAMEAICSSQGFLTESLLDENATADAIIGAIGQAAHNVASGDTFIITYSGHGGEIPDETGDSDTGLDQTWVAFDRMIVDHELYNLWGQFEPGVRIEVYSDSCHSGTVIRELLTPAGKIKWLEGAKPAPSWAAGDSGKRNFQQVFSKASAVKPSREAPSAAVKIGDQTLRRRTQRFIPPAIALQVYQAHRQMYSALQWSRRRTEIGATVILISGCQDNQTSADGDTNGLFTEKLLHVWDEGSFSGTLPQFHRAILALMPSDQTPNYFEVGTHEDVFTESRPLTIVEALVEPDQPDVPTEPDQPAEPRAPTMTGPDTYDRGSDEAPAFDVDPGSNTYYIVEFTSDPELFGNFANRSSETFYGSWDDPDAPARFTDSVYTLPANAWEALKGNDRIYYRVGSTSSETGWDDYMVSTTDGDAVTSAPFVMVEEQRAVAAGAKSRAAGADLRYQS